MSEGSRVRALFLDRDGVVNHELGYVHRPDQVIFIEGIFSLCRKAMELNYRIIIVTNQSGIGRGYYSSEQFEALSKWMETAFRNEGVRIDAVYHCPYHPEFGVGEY